jgi:hypothetical protein
MNWHQSKVWRKQLRAQGLTKSTKGKIFGLSDKINRAFNPRFKIYQGYFNKLFLDKRKYPLESAISTVCSANPSLVVPTALTPFQLAVLAYQDPKGWKKHVSLAVQT